MNPKSTLLSDGLEKGLRILNLFAQERDGFTLTDIARLVGINKTSVYRFVNTYCELGYLRKDPRTKLLKLGPRSVALAHSFLRNSDTWDVVKPLVDEIHSQYQVHVDVALLQGDSVFLIYRRESPETRMFRHFTISKGLHYLATGKAALAFLPPEERLRLVAELPLERKTVRTIVYKTELLADLDRTVERGYSLNDEEFVPGLIAIGAPLIDGRTNRVVGGVSFDSSTAKYFMTDFERVYAPKIVALAKDISAIIPSS